MPLFSLHVCFVYFHPAIINEYIQSRIVECLVQLFGVSPSLGALGKQTVKDLGFTTKDNLVSISADKKAVDAFRMMCDSNLSGLPVIGYVRCSILFSVSCSIVLGMMCECVCVRVAMICTIYIDVFSCIFFNTFSPSFLIIKLYHLLMSGRVDGTLVGNISERDLQSIQSNAQYLKMLYQPIPEYLAFMHEHQRHQPSASASGTPRRPLIVQCQPTDSFQAVVERVVEHKVHRCYVVDSAGKLVSRVEGEGGEGGEVRLKVMKSHIFMQTGVISLHDILAALVKSSTS